MTTLSVDEVTPIELIKKVENEQKIVLIWFDPNNELYNDTEDFKIRLHQINDCVVFHTELQSCINFIQSTEKEKIFLVLIGSSASQILPHIISLNQIVCIIIFCLKGNSYGHLSLKDSKIIYINDELDLLYLSIQEQIDLAEEQIHKWCFFDQDEYANKNLSKQSSDFLWLHLFHDVLSHLSNSQQAKEQLINACRYYYRDNPEQLQYVDQFSNEYEAKDALHWFINNSFLNKMINRACRMEDTNLLYTLRYFLCDLLQNLTHEHQQIVQSNREKLIVYRTMKLSSGEFNQFQENKGKLISMKGFLTANTKRSSPLVLSTKPSDLISVLFEIECDLNGNFIFADIKSASEETILFDFNTNFRLETIEQHEQIWLIKLNAVNDGRDIIQKYIHDTRCQIEDLSIPIIFGKLICDMGQWNRSQIYFECLLKDSPDEDLAWIEHSIGQCHQWKGEWNEARICFDRSLEQMIKTEPARIKDSAVVLSDIGEILHLQGKYEEAYDFHQRALTIRKNYYPPDHTHIATSLDNIGLVHFQQRKYDEALVSLHLALAIRERYYNGFHVDVAMSLNNIGYILTQQIKYEEAFNNHQRAMSIYKKYYPSGHVCIAFTLNSIGDILCGQDKYDEALDINQQALTMQKKYHPSGHIDMATSLIEIAEIKYRQEKYEESLDVYHQALTIQMKYYSSSHLNFFNTLNHIGYIQLYGKQNYDEAIHYHQQALTMLETYYPSYYAHIALTLNYIGIILRKQGKNDEALDLFQRALKMQEDYFLSDHIDMTAVLSNIARTLKSQGKRDTALEFYQRALLIKKKYYPSSHMTIIKCLMAIGKVKYHQRKLDEALHYYQRVVLILEKFHPTNHTKMVLSMEWIAQILCQKRSYDRAIVYLEKYLKISEVSLSSETLTGATVLSKLSHAHRHLNQYELSLMYELRCFLLREKILPPNDPKISKSLSNIGKCYERLNQLKLARDYYRQTLVVYKQYLPYEHHDRWNLEAKISQLSVKLETININQS